jgi:hypothetical protein
MGAVKKKPASPDADDDLVVGAGAIAAEYFDDDDEKHRRRVYRNAEGLPLFSFRGKLCAFRTALRAHKDAVRHRRRELADQMTKAAAQTPPLVPLPRRRRRRPHEAAASTGTDTAA